MKSQEAFPSSGQAGKTSSTDGDSFGGSKASPVEGFADSLEIRVLNKETAGDSGSFLLASGDGPPKVSLGAIVAEIDFSSLKKTRRRASRVKVTGSLDLGVGSRNLHVDPTSNPLPSQSRSRSGRVSISSASFHFEKHYSNFPALQASGVCSNNHFHALSLIEESPTPDSRN
ncbi:hypothetical protein NE237_008463 [Protea cynaroides]|uniref:Uncharacterized protein n=1 Tax=Protea cynaroides TaxID=273540 RepID=A0A9Q0QZD7_9MAGN|nr:hypothetical protein NE237_008463 [Protea cynaroides]